MDPKQFRNLAADEVKGRCSASQRAFLNQHVVEWEEALASLDVETSGRVSLLNGRLADVRRRMIDLDSVPSELILAELDLMERVDKASRFLEYVRARLNQVRCNAVISTDIKDESDDFLRSAIEEHRRLIEKNVDPNRADASLYDALEGRWTFGNISEAS